MHSQFTLPFPLWVCHRRIQFSLFFVSLLSFFCLDCKEDQVLASSAGVVVIVAVDVVVSVVIFFPLLGPPHSTPILHVHAQRRTSFAKSFHLRRRCWTLFLYVLSWVFSCQFCSSCCWFSVVVVLCFRCSDCDGSSLSCQETRASVR